MDYYYSNNSKKPLGIVITLSVIMLGLIVIIVLKNVVSDSDSNSKKKASSSDSSKVVSSTDNGSDYLNNSTNNTSDTQNYTTEVVLTGAQIYDKIDVTNEPTQKPIVTKRPVVTKKPTVAPSTLKPNVTVKPSLQDDNIQPGGPTFPTSTTKPYYTVEPTQETSIIDWNTITRTYSGTSRGGSLYVTLTGTANVEVEGIFQYYDKYTGEWITNKWSQKLNTNGTASVSISVPYGVTNQTFQVNKIELKGAVSGKIYCNIGSISFG